MDGLLPIGEFSHRCGLSRRQLRSYSKLGLLAARAVDPNNGYRCYAADQVGDAQLIGALRGAGMPLAQARELLTPHHPNTQEILVIRLHAAGRTHVGGRETNEDSVLATEQLIAIADGMGGAPGGEVASALATELIAASYGVGSVDRLDTAVRAANWTVWHQAGTSAALDRMGTTICAVGILADATLAVANVGDSRAYLVHERDCRRLTSDHSVTADLVRRGELEESAVGQHPHHGLLTRALGVAPRVDVDTPTHEAHRGDRLMVCSDGLTNVVTDVEIAELLCSGEPDENAFRPSDVTEPVRILVLATSALTGSAQCRRCPA